MKQKNKLISLFSKKNSNQFTHKSQKEINLQAGKIAEQIAAKFLTKNKLTLITKNYTCRQGEIDLIMQDSKELVFIEVRYRKKTLYGTALETISKQKIHRIRTAINHYIMTNNLGYISCRFDVIGLHGNLDNPSIDWIKNVFIE